MTADHTVAEGGYQERDDCAEAVAAARAGARWERDMYREQRDRARSQRDEAYADGAEAVRIWHSQYSRVRAELDALRAAIEALADKWEGDRLNRVIDKEGAAYLLRDALQATS